MTLFGVNAIALVLLSALAFFMPRMIAHLRKHNVSILGTELVPIAFPAFAVLGFYKDDNQIGVGFTAMSIAYFAGFFWERRKAGQAKER